MSATPKTLSSTAAPPQITILVGEASRVTCELMEVALTRVDNFKVVASAVSSSEVAASVEASNPHVALVASNLEDGALAGFRAVREGCRLRPWTRFVMLLDSNDRALVIDAFRAGAKGVFCRKDSLSALYKCIAAVHSSQIWANSLELQYLLEALVSTKPLRVVNVKGEDLLTRRELDVVVLVAEGHSNRQISEKLQLSEHTVKNYLFHVFDKLGVSSRAELILYVLAQREMGQEGRPSLLDSCAFQGGAQDTLGAAALLPTHITSGRKMGARSLA